MKMRLAAGVAALGMLGSGAGMAAAQDAPATLPDLGNYSLPSSQPTPVVPLVVPPAPVATSTPTPRATPTARVTPTARATPTPQPSATPTPRATPTPVATPSPSTTATPVATPEPVASPTSAAPAVAPTALAPPVAEPVSATPSERPAWLWPVVLGLILLTGMGLFAWRRRRQAEPADVPVLPVVDAVPPPEAPPVSRAPAVPVAPTAPRFLDQAASAPAPRLDLDEPAVSRAGLNMVTATADVTVTVRNVSDVAAQGVTLDVRLTSAQPGQDAAIAAMFAGPVPRPATPPFDLAPGEARKVRALATMPRDAITVLQAGGRPMFVPVVAIRAVHAGGQTTSVHALGIERPGQAKLGPFWLDQPMRMYDTIGVRPHSGR
ncbi:superantigen-like protein SSL4 [Sphingomonas jeddahensis]|nr:hypothetical protein [Sphingomonas jeddahensis]